MDEIIEDSEIIDTPIDEIQEESSDNICEVLGVKMTIKEMDYLMCEQSKGKYLVVENGKVVAKSPTVSKEYTLNHQIVELKSKLEETDYIVLKIAEAENETGKQELREIYAEELKQRKEWRDKINELEKQLKGESV